VLSAVRQPEITWDKRYQNELSSGTNGNAAGYEPVSSRRSAHVRLDGLGSPPALGPFFEPIARICARWIKGGRHQQAAAVKPPLHIASVLRRMRPTHYC